MANGSGLLWVSPKDGDIDIVLKSVLVYRYHYSGVTRKGEIAGGYKFN